MTSSNQNLNSSSDYTAIVCENNSLRNRLAESEMWVKAYQDRLSELETMEEKQGRYIVAEILLKIERGQGTPLRVLEKPTKDEAPPPKGTLYMTKSDLEHIKELLNHEHWYDKEPIDWDSEDEELSTYEQLKGIANRVCTDM